MIRSLNTAASGMQAQQDNIDTIANNIANVSTIGFKRSRAEFEDLMYQTQKEPGAMTGNNAISPTGVQIGLGVKTSAVQKEFETGDSKVTGAAYDIKIQGPGFFVLQKGDGETVYTRDGSFKKGPDGRLQDKSGNMLVPEIRIPPNATGVEVSSDGTVSVLIDKQINPQVVGQIQLVNFVNPAGLKAMGGNVYTPSASSGTPQQSVAGQNGVGSLAQGQLETSNVNIVEEMVSMIAAQRAYETNSKVIQASDQMLQSINNMR